jgi:hypothetical protein
MKKSIPVLLIICVWILACNTSIEKKNTKIEAIDSITSIINLQQFELSNVVAYKIGNATIITKQKVFEQSIKSIWLKYKEGMNDLSVEDDVEFKSAYTARFKLLDSTLKILISNKKPNIIYLNHKTFERLEFRPPMDFEKQLENGDCALFDKNNKRQYRIIRRKFSEYFGPLNASAGRRYYLVGEADFFYETVDSIS